MRRSTLLLLAVIFLAVALAILLAASAQAQTLCPSILTFRAAAGTAPYSQTFGAPISNAQFDQMVDCIEELLAKPNKITAQHLKAADSPADEECVTYEATGTTLEWQACGGAGSSIILDLADDGSNESVALSEVAVIGDTNSIFTEPSADKLLIAVGNAWPTANDLVGCTNCIGATEVDGGSLESEVEAVVDLQDLQGAVTDPQVPDTVTIAGTASKCARFSSGGVLVAASGDCASGDTVEGDGNGWLTTLKMTTETVTADTTLSNDSDLRFSMLANTKYAFRLVVHYATVDAADFKYALSGPASPTLVNIWMDCTTPATGACTPRVDTSYLGSTAVGGVTGGGIVQFYGTVHNGANAGDFVFQWAQSVSDAGNTSVLAGSYIESRIDSGTPANSDSIRVEDGDNAGTFTSVTNADLDDSGDINFTQAVGPPSVVTATIRNDKILEPMLKVVDAPADEEFLTYESTTGDFEWQAGAGGSPGGSDTQVQFNDAGAFGGDAGLTFNKTTDALSGPVTINGPAGGMTITGGTGAVENLILKATSHATPGKVIVQGQINDGASPFQVKRLDGANLLRVDDTGSASVSLYLGAIAQEIRVGYNSARGAGFWDYQGNLAGKFVALSGIGSNDGSATNPSLRPKYDTDPNTGVGWNAADDGRLIAGGISSLAFKPGTARVASSCYVATDQTNATTTMQSTTCTISNLQAAYKYRFTCSFFMSDSVPAEGAAIDFNGGTATETNFRAQVTAFDTALAVSTQADDITDATTATTFTGNGNFEVHGSFEPAAGGTFLPRFAQSTHATGTLTLYRGSNCQMWEMP